LNKKGSNFLVLKNECKQYSDLEEAGKQGSEEDYDDTEGSSGDEYEFEFL